MELKKSLPEKNRLYIFLILMFAGGYMGGFTYTIRGGVFCNAQTGNLLKAGIFLGQGHFADILPYVWSLAAYMFGAVLSERLLKKKWAGSISWEASLVGLEALWCAVLAFLPESAPLAVTQISVNIMASMQYNTFRQADNISMATTFCTGHVKNMSVALQKWAFEKNAQAGKTALKHLSMLFSFIIGAAAASYISPRVMGKSILVVTVILALVFMDLVKYDRAHRGE